MRLSVQLRLDTPVSVPINHQQALAFIIYQWLERSEGEGKRVLGESGEGRHDKAFKLFTFSSLRAPRRAVEGDRLKLFPPFAEWIIGSPLDSFLDHLATGLMESGALKVGGASLSIRQIQLLPSSELVGSGARFTCLSPIVASIGERREGKLHSRYFLPTEGEPFSEAVRANLLRKYRLIYGKEPDDTRFRLRFDQTFLQTKTATKLIEYNGIHIRGAFAPFSVEGSPELIRLGYECGFGEKNSSGFGMAELVKPVN